MTTTVKQQIVDAGRANPDLDRAELATRLGTTLNYVATVLADAGIRPTPQTISAPAAPPAAAHVTAGTPTAFQDLDEDDQLALYESQLRHEAEFYTSALSDLSHFVDHDLPRPAGLDPTDWSAADGDFHLEGTIHITQLPVWVDKPEGVSDEIDIRVDRDGVATVSFSFGEREALEETFTELTGREWKTEWDFHDSLSDQGIADAQELAADHNAAVDTEFGQWQAEIAAQDDRDAERFEAQVTEWAEQQHASVAEAFSDAIDHYFSFEAFQQHHANTQWTRDQVDAVKGW